MDCMRFAAAPVIIVFALAISPGRALASETADVTAAVHRYVDNLDDKTAQIALAMCDSYVSILDEFPPFEWHGSQACAEWWDAFGTYGKPVKESASFTVALKRTPADWRITAWAYSKQ